MVFMNNRKAYEELLEIQCETFSKMIYLIQQISKCDTSLHSQAQKDTPDVSVLEKITFEKDRLIQSLDILSKSASTAQLEIYKYQFEFLDAFSHPLYLKLEALEGMAMDKLNNLVAIEDSQNPTTIQQLNAYKERLELDIKIKEVPMEKRQIFFVDLKNP